MAPVPSNIFPPPFAVLQKQTHICSFLPVCTITLVQDSILRDLDHCSSLLISVSAFALSSTLYSSWSSRSTCLKCKLDHVVPRLAFLLITLTIKSKLSLMTFRALCDQDLHLQPHFLSLLSPSVHSGHAGLVSTLGTELILTSTFLDQLFPLPGMLFPWLFTGWLLFAIQVLVQISPPGQWRWAAAFLDTTSKALPHSSHLSYYKVSFFHSTCHYLNCPL